MKTTQKCLVAMVLAMVFNGQAVAETGKSVMPAPALKTAAWDRVGDAGANGQPANLNPRLQAPGEEGLRARKADMVRRMFWIMLAHR